MHSKTSMGLVFAVLLAATSVAGCSRSEPEPEFRTMKGKTVSVDLTSGRVSMNAWLPNRQEWRKVEGVVTDQTEVFVNGRTVTLDEVKVGDTVEVTGYSQGEGVDRQWVAVKVNVTRTDIFATSAPASPPPTSD